MADLARENATLGNGGRNPQGKAVHYAADSRGPPAFLGESGFVNSDFRFRESRREYIRKPKQRGRRYKAVFAAKGAYLQAFWRKAHLIGATLGRCATISHGKVFRRMKFSKRMLVMLVATVMLVAGSLSYFAYANDVEQCGAEVICSRPGCNGSVSRALISFQHTDYLMHRYGNNDEYACHYERGIATFQLECRGGVDGPHNAGTSTEVAERGHTCGRHY